MNIPIYVQRWTRLQILQTALQFCSKNMPNFHKRRFRYFERGFPHKRRFFRAFGSELLPIFFTQSLQESNSPFQRVSPGIMNKEPHTFLISSAFCVEPVCLFLICASFC